MDRDEPIFEAYDGVELRLADGNVVKSPALTVTEAVQFTRPPIAVDEDGLATEAGFRAIGEHFRAFCERVGIVDVPLGSLGLDGVDDIDLSTVPVRVGLEVAIRQSMASDMPDTVAGAEAVGWLLDEVPAEFGLDDPPVDVAFDVARRVRIALYRHLDWLLRRFFAVLAQSPGVRTMQIGAAAGSAGASAT